MPLIGYARVSTEDQTPLPQSQALKSTGCAEIHEEQASGGNRARPVLARVLERIGKGDTLVVVRIDRLARSLSHLLEVIERLEAKGAFFRSIQDPIDTGSPQGKFTLQVLGAAAEFERALIRERTKAGLASARTKGRVGGNPGLRARDPAALTIHFASALAESTNGHSGGTSTASLNSDSSSAMTARTESATAFAHPAGSASVTDCLSPPCSNVRASL